MGLLYYKLKKYGGIRNLLGRNGFDFWIAFISAVSFLILYKLNIIDLNWRNETLSFFNVFIIIITVSFALISLLYSFRNKFSENNDFNIWLIEKDIIDELEFLIDFPLFVITVSIMVSILYGILLIMFSVTNEIMAFLFAIPIFFITYGFVGFIYAMKTVEQYSKEYNKYTKLKIADRRRLK